MSELYDAIKKIEDKEKKHDIPDFSVKKRNKPPYVLIVSVLAFIVFALLTGLLILHKVGRVEVKKNNIQKQFAVKSAKKVVLTKKSETTKKSEKIGNNLVVAEKKFKQNRKEKEVLVLKRSVKKSNVKIAKNDDVYHKKPLIRERKEENKKITRISVNRETKVKKVRFTYSIGTLLEEAKSGDFSTSVKAYKTLIKIYPNNISLYNNLAAEYIDAGMYKEAADVLNKALNIKDDPDIRINLAICYVKLGRFDLAQKVLENVTPPEKDKPVFNELLYILNLNR